MDDIEQRPAYRRLLGAPVFSIRHLRSDDAAAEAVRFAGLPWPVANGDLAGAEPYLCRLGPTEVLAFSARAGGLDSLARGLAPRKHATCVASELTHGVIAFELLGSAIDAWLTQLIDSSSIPRKAQTAARARFVDIPVALLRTDASRLILIAERTFDDYIDAWLKRARAQEPWPNAA